MDKRTPVLSVKNLKQHFKSGIGRNKLVVKAVDGISFDIYKGEVFGLVGESGCGKTTTGRSIIKLYEPTDGEVVFMGTRISAGIDGLREEIRNKNQDVQQETARLKEVLKEELERASGNQAQAAKAKEDYQEAVQKIKMDRAEFVSSARSEIAIRKSDTNDFDRELMKNMQMIFQDPIASLNPRMTVKEIIAEGLRINAGNSTLHKKIKAVKSSTKVEIKALEREHKLALQEAVTNGEDTTKLENAFEKELDRITARMDELLKPLINELDVRNNTDIKRKMKDAKENNRTEEISKLKEELVSRKENDVNAKVNSVLKTVGLLPEHASRYPHEFSGGQRQRIGIARALIVAPAFIIADEPISALDVSIQAQVINLLNDLRDEFGITIMFIAHDLSVVKYFSDRIGVMYYGKMVELANTDELFKNPLHPYTRSLLSAVPLPDPRYEKNRTRIKYNPRTDHDYSAEAPTLAEISPGHFVLANTAELDKYRAKLK
jgi:oligopeptide transport system ATP-binding protein